MKDSQAGLTTPISSGHASAAKPATAFSCVRCFERKVKCDRQRPCSACEKHSADCIYRVPPPPRRRKKRAQEEILTERLRRYERALQQQGINPSDVARAPEPSIRSDQGGRRESDTDAGHTPQQSDAGSVASDRKFVSEHLIFDQGRSHYVDNHLWSRVAEEFTSPQDHLNVSSDEDDDDSDSQGDDDVDFVLAVTPSSNNPRVFHPPSEQILSLWHIYVQNFDPITKVIHRPTMFASIQQAIKDLERVPRALEALLFAIYGAAILTLKENDCEYQFGEKKQALLSRYTRATKVALSRAKFIGTTDLMVLQALIIHLLSMRNAYDSRTLWVLTGVATRIAEGMGLHRDGSVLGLPFFETEMRRRVWWQLLMLEYRSAELAGSKKFKNMFIEEHTTFPPLNVNDEDIYPGMLGPIPPRSKATEMIFCSLRYTFGSYWSRHAKEMNSKSRYEESSIWGNFDSVEIIREKDKLLDGLEKILQDEFLGLCDPTVPIQLAASLLAANATKVQRLMVHHPRRYPRESDVPETERRLLWSLSMATLETDNMCHSNRKLQGFIWHVSSYFQWIALIYILDCLRAQPLMSEAGEAWAQVDEVYEHHPEFVTDTRRPIHVAVGTLCLKAYTAREYALAGQGISVPLRPPEYITKLRVQREASQSSARKRAAANKTPSQNSDRAADFDSPQLYDFSDMVNVPPFEQPQQQSLEFQQMQGISQPALQAAWDGDFGFQYVSPNTDSSYDSATDMGGASGATNQAMDWDQWDSLLKGFGMNG